MTRLVALISALVFMPLAAYAQNETVIVRANALDGVWKLTLPFEAGKAPVERLCRIWTEKGDIRINCLGFSVDGKAGHITVEGNHILLSWGASISGLFTIDGALLSPMQFAGAMQVKFFLFFRKKTLSDARGSKLDLSAVAPDKSGTSDMVENILQSLSEGRSPALSHTPEAFKGEISALATAKQIAALGAIQQIMRVDTEADSAIVYAVEFAAGERLCRIHQREDGVLDGFLCV